MCPYVMTSKLAGDEISSTYEGRHVECQESDLIHPYHVDGLVDEGDPVLMGGNVVGVALADALAATDIIAIDTEGIWALSCSATDEVGDSAIAHGDQIFALKTVNALTLTKNRNKNTHQSFGYALSTLGSGTPGIVAVKVHWDPDDDVEMVGNSAAFLAMGTARSNGREYRYRSTKTSGDIRGQYMALALNGAGGSGEAHRGRTIVEAVGVLTAHGGHHGLEFDTDGTITGLGVGHRATFMGPNRALFATIAGGMSELWAEGASTNFAAASQHSIHRFVLDGESTGRATARNAFEFVNIPTGAGTTYMLDTGQNGIASTDGLRVIINGAVYMMLLVSV